MPKNNRFSTIAFFKSVARTLGQPLVLLSAGGWNAIKTEMYALQVLGEEKCTIMEGLLDRLTREKRTYWVDNPANRLGDSEKSDKLRRAVEELKGFHHIAVSKDGTKIRPTFRLLAKLAYHVSSIGDVKNIRAGITAKIKRNYQQVAADTPFRALYRKRTGEVLNLE